ncbi:MAG TPA: TraM recognition domain-containing protein [Solirubrobacteraceae bacterium]|jgi:type IV secretory pathway TraG/TraD family ATPase VirD4
MFAFEQLILKLLELCAVSLFGGVALAMGLRVAERRWTWASLGFPLAWVLAGISPLFAAMEGSASVVGCFVGMVWHAADLAEGADRADAARARLGILEAVREAVARRQVASGGWVDRGRLTVGHARHGRPVQIKAGGAKGSHALIVGATGSGKTVSEGWIATKLIAHGYGAIAIDPKGDGMLREQLEHAAHAAGREFLEWTPDGPCAYNPYAYGTDSEIADKALVGEVFTEPHYLRLTQRYLGHAVRAMRAAQIQVTPGTLMAHLDPEQLELTGRGLDEQQAGVVQAYLDSLGDRGRRDLMGARDRLSILVESDIGRWLDPAGAKAIDLQAAIESRAVVYFGLESDRMPLLGQMLGAAIVSDLVVVSSHFQNNPIETVVLIDEFSAIGASHVARLFGRARGAGLSVLLATQEFADLDATGPAVREQVLGNLDTLIAHRQNVPTSAELVADIAGGRAAWVTSQATEAGLLGRRASGRGTRRREYVREIQSSVIQGLGVGEALVVKASERPRAVVARMSLLLRRDEVPVREAVRR